MSELPLKVAVRKRDGWKCVRCGLTNQEHLDRTGKQLEVHRIVPGSRYTVEGCETLCRACHHTKPKRRPGQQDHGGGYVKVNLARGVFERLKAAAPDTPVHKALRRAVLDYLPKVIAQRRRTLESFQQHQLADALEVSLDELAGREFPAKKKGGGR